MIINRVLVLEAEVEGKFVLRSEVAHSGRGYL
jgi:hypothetical protein